MADLRQQEVELLEQGSARDAVLTQDLDDQEIERPTNRQKVPFIMGAMLIAALMGLAIMHGKSNQSQAKTSLLVEKAEGQCAGNWQQCGGQNFQGPTCCNDGYACKSQSDYFSNCQPSDHDTTHHDHDGDGVADHTHDEHDAQMHDHDGDGVADHTHAHHHGPHDHDHDHEEPTPAPEPEPDHDHDEHDHDHEDCALPLLQCGGADNYDGPTCCQHGYTCTKHNDWYSNCVKDLDHDTTHHDHDGDGVADHTHEEHDDLMHDHDGDGVADHAHDEHDEAIHGPLDHSHGDHDHKCAHAYEQCGGEGHQGPTCCPDGFSCSEDNKYHHRCVKKEHDHDHNCALDGLQCGGDATFQGPTCCQPGSSCKKHNDWYSNCQKQ